MTPVDHIWRSKYSIRSLTSMDHTTMVAPEEIPTILSSVSSMWACHVLHVCWAEESGRLYFFASLTDNDHCQQFPAGCPWINYLMEEILTYAARFFREPFKMANLGAPIFISRYLVSLLNSARNLMKIGWYIKERP